jgi:hypothetical protein
LPECLHFAFFAFMSFGFFFTGFGPQEYNGPLTVLTTLLTKLFMVPIIQTHL